MKNSTSNDIIKIKREATKEELESFKLSKHLLRMMIKTAFKTLTQKQKKVV